MEWTAGQPPVRAASSEAPRVCCCQSARSWERRPWPWPTVHRLRPSGAPQGEPCWLIARSLAGQPWPDPGLFSPRPSYWGALCWGPGNRLSCFCNVWAQLFWSGPLTSHIPTLPHCRHRLEEGQATSWSRRLKVFLCCTRTKDSQSVSTGKSPSWGSHPAVGDSGGFPPQLCRVGQE